MAQPPTLFSRTLEPVLITVNADPMALRRLASKLPYDIMDVLVTYLVLDDEQVLLRAIREGYNNFLHTFYRPGYHNTKILIREAIKSDNIPALHLLLETGDAIKDYFILGDVCLELASRDERVLAELFKAERKIRPGDEASIVWRLIAQSFYGPEYFAPNFIRDFLSEGVSPLISGEHYHDALYMAAVWGDQELIEALLRDYPMRASGKWRKEVAAGAARGGHLDLYLTYYPPNIRTPDYSNGIVYHAIDGGHRRMIEEVWSLLKHPSDEIGDYLIVKGCKDILAAIIRHRDMQLLKDFLATPCKRRTVPRYLVSEGIGYLPDGYVLQYASEDRKYSLIDVIMKGHRVLLEVMLNSWPFDDELREAALYAANKRGDSELLHYLHQRFQ